MTAPLLIGNKLMTTKLKLQIRSLKQTICWTLLISLASPVIGQSKFVANYDENKIKPYKLPQILIDETGNPVESSKQWQNHLGQQIC